MPMTKAALMMMRMEKQPIWLHTFGFAFPFSAQISQTLQDKGAAICDFNDDEAARGGIVFFAQVTDKLCDFVRDKSHNGFDRVMGVLVNPDASGCVDAWKILEAGASDVLTCQKFDQYDLAQRILDRAAEILTATP